MSDTYRDIGGPNGKLARCEAFTGNSMSARNGHGGAYSVYSYSTEIARVVETDTGLVAFVTRPGTYSTTTSRQQNLCRAWLPGEKRDVRTAERGRTLDIEATV